MKSGGLTRLHSYTVVIQNVRLTGKVLVTRDT